MRIVEYYSYTKLKENDLWVNKVDIRAGKFEIEDLAVL